MKHLKTINEMFDPDYPLEECPNCGEKKLSNEIGTHSAWYECVGCGETYTGRELYDARNAKKLEDQNETSEDN